MWRSSVAILLVLTTRASADKAAADAAFSAAKALMAQGKIAEACPKFELSQKEDPQIGSLLNVADCHEQLGKLATAWAEFREAADLAKARNDDRQAFAKDRSEKLAPRVAHIKLAGDAKGLHVSLDGRDVTALVGERIPVDPGEHAITSKQGTAPETTSNVKITKDGETLEIRIPIEAEARIDDTPRPKSKRKVIGLVTAGAGLVVAGVGLYFGKRAFDQYDESRDHCDDSNACDPRGAELIDNARSSALTSNILIGVGVSAVAVGAVLWLTAPKERSTAVTARPVVGPSTVAGVIELRF